MSEINFGNPYTDITAESLEQAAETKFSPPPQSPEAPADEGEGNAQPSPSSEQVEVEQAEAPPEYTINGRAYSQAEIESFAQFDSLLRSDPRLGQVIYDYLHGNQPVPSSGGVGTAPGQGGQPPTPGWGNQPTPAPVPPTQQVQQPQQPQSAQPLQIDPEALQDPTVNFLWNTIQQQNQTLDNFRSEISRLGSITSSRVEAESRSIIDTAVEEFKSTYQVDDTVAQQVRLAAARLEVIPSVLRGIDPITGQPTDPNPLNAVRRAMEIAAYGVPEVRDRIIAAQLQQQSADSQRKQLLNGVGGSSRTVPRNTPAPTSPQDIKTAMIQEVAAAMNGNNGQGA